MNQIFDFGRFWKFFKYDMVRTFRANSTKLLSFVITPVSAYLIYGFVGMIFGEGWNNVGVIPRMTYFVIVSAIFFIYYSANCYGFLTDKKPGISWLMIPASVTEKYLTMLLNVLVVAPVVYLVLTLGLDWIYSAIFSDGSGSIVGFIASATDSQFASVAGEFSPVKISRVSAYTMIQPTAWTPLIILLLGGISFKKNKVAKTILCYVAASIAFSIVLAGIINILPDGFFDSFIDWMDSPRKGEFLLNTIVFVFTAVPCVAFAVAVFFRLKNIKH